jgi:hypothetical protein
VRDPAPLSVLGLAHDGTPALDHARRVGARLHRPVAALIGAWSPVTADEGERVVQAPLVIAAALAVMWTAGLAAGARALGGRPAALMLGGAALLTVAAFPFPVRSEPYTIRFLTPALVPLAVILGAGASRLGGARAWLVVIPLCLGQLWAGAALLRAWRAAGPDALVPDCARVLEALRRAQVARAYASYHSAYCVTYTSGETVIASQPWNERFWGHPLPYLDEVRSAPRVAWVLAPGVDFELPAPRTFEAKLAGLGARYQRNEAGRAVVYADFAPRLERAAAGVIEGPAGDGDVATRVLEPPIGSATFALTRPVRASGLTLLAAPGRPWLPTAFNLEVSSDGTTFERVARRRRGGETSDLMWLGGQPRFAADELAYSTVLDGRPVRAVRITPIGPSSAWAVSEVLVHPEPPGADGPALDANALYRSLFAARP